MIKTISAGIIKKQAATIDKHLLAIERLRNVNVTCDNCGFKYARKHFEAHKQCPVCEAAEYGYEIERLRDTVCEQNQKLRAQNPARDMANECNEMSSVHLKELYKLRRYRQRAKKSYCDLQAAYDRVMKKTVGDACVLKIRTDLLADAYQTIGIKGDEIAALEHIVDDLDRSLAELVDNITQAERAAFEAGWRKAFGYYHQKQPGDMEACWGKYAEAKDANPVAE